MINLHIYVFNGLSMSCYKRLLNFKPYLIHERAIAGHCDTLSFFILIYYWWVGSLMFFLFVEFHGFSGLGH